MAVVTNYKWTFSELKQAMAKRWGSWENAVDIANQYGIDLTDPSTLIEQVESFGYVPIDSVSGNITALTADQLLELNTAAGASAVNSNVSNVARTKVAPALNTTIDTATQKATFSLKPKTGSFTQNAQYYLGQVGNAVGAVTAGISLGKVFAGALYNAYPDIWDAQGMSTLNPETWNNITAGDDSLGASLINFLLGLDPDSGNVQPYMDADALAYYAMYMKQFGVFATATGTFATNTNVADSVITQPIAIGTSSAITNNYWTRNRTITNSTSPVYFGLYQVPNDRSLYLFVISENPFTMQTEWVVSSSDTRISTNTYSSVAGNYNGHNYYGTWFTDDGTSWGSLSPLPINASSTSNLTYSQQRFGAIGEVIFYGSIETTGTIDGISDQTGATLPDTSTWDSVPNTLTSLQTQYPDMFNNALTYDVLQPDGSVITKTYVPVTLPDTNSLTSADPWNDQQPTSSTQTQTQTQIDTENATQTILDLLTKTLTQTQTLPKTDLDNPTDTGTGTTDPPLLPTGNASALWSVYHPTQAQVNSFGAWLWSDDFLTNILKIMNDPMSGIITLHKVFAPPVDSGTGTIVVGKLDSEVPSATVNQQYVTVDCGSVDLLEQFGNVFDYNPYTDVSLYLPFIGIVPLDTADVMRSTIHVVYGVDVYTGACLAQVEVSRDANTVNMYQYAGVCSVEYPLTGAQHSGLISGLLGIGTSVAGLVTGNAPMAIGGVAGGIASAAKRNQSRANSFSGNAGAMGIKTPYLIISRPQTKVAQTFPELQGFPTNASVTLSQCSGQVRVRAVHVEGINATESELREIESLLTSGVLV